MKLASISFDRQVYVIQNGPMEFVVELGFLAPMKAGMYEAGFGYDFRYAITSKHSRRQMIAFFEGIDIWKTNEFLAFQREFEKGVEY
ncbi:MAG: hypothetical protein EBW61_02985 [Rhodobacteraceae bacterium]|nr:hypothetical protein [Paracoccaceae bacterium]